MARPKLLFLPPDSSQTRQLFPAPVMTELESIADVETNGTPEQFTEERLCRAIATKQVCVTGWRSPRITERVLEAATDLRLILHSAGTVNPYVTPAVFERGIVVTSANSAMARVTAEAALALMMIGSWETRKWIGIMEGGGWKTAESTVPGLQGRTVGIVGFGAVTRALLPLLAPFRTRKILVNSLNLDENEARRLGAQAVCLEELLSTADIVSLQASLTPASRHLLNAERLKLLKDGCLLVNIGRGELIDEEALVAELQTGRFRAVLDVYTNEPLDPKSPLRSLPNVTCLPHLGAATEYCRESMGRDVVENLREFLDGKVPHGMVAAGTVAEMSTH